MRSWTKAVLDQIAGHNLNRTLPLDIQATAFQRRVWTHLQSLPFGVTQSYGEVAKAIGRPPPLALWRVRVQRIRLPWRFHAIG